MDKDTNIDQLMEDLDKVMNLIKKIGESNIEDVDSLKEEIKFTRDELKNRYVKEDSTKTNSSET